jgi:hypothetical protein
MVVIELGISSDPVAWNGFPWRASCGIAVAA